MRSVFDDEEKLERARTHRDTELTLGSGTLFAIFLGLVLLCGLCFGMGYALGHRNSGPTAITQPQPASDQEPLQANSGIPKPSAISQTPDAPVAPAPTDQTGAAPNAAPPAQNGTAPAPTTPAPAQTVQPQAQPQVHPALGPAEPPPSYAANPGQQVHPAMQQQLMVQIAAVSNPEDADVLVNALRKRNYPVSARRDPADNFIHVRIGPFATRQLADQWRNKLLNDGYNAVVQP